MPGGFKNIKPSDGKETQFSSTNQPKNRGRKPKIYTVLKEMGYGAEDVKLAFGELAFYGTKDLQEVANDEERPIIVRIVASSFLEAYKNKDYVKVREIMEHIIGKAVQPSETKLTLADAPQFTWADEEDEE